MHVLLVAASPEDVPVLPKADVVIAVDGGYSILQERGVTVDWIVGDFDSYVGDVPESAIRYPSEKDATDLEIALEAAKDLGATRIDVFGALGGRLDMTMANLGLLETYPMMRLHGTGHEVFLAQSTERIPRQAGCYLSFLPWKQATISIEGVKYPLTRHDVSTRTALTVSNEWVEDVATLTVHQGQVLVLIVNKEI